MGVKFLPKKSRGMLVSDIYDVVFLNVVIEITNSVGRSVSVMRARIYIIELGSVVYFGS